MSEPQSYTAEECRGMFLQHVHAIVDYWCCQGKDRPAACSGVAFSILTLLDGVRGFPALSLRLSPHPDDKQDSIDNGSKYFEPDMEINDCCLHELYCKGENT